MRKDITIRPMRDTYGPSHSSTPLHLVEISGVPQFTSPVISVLVVGSKSTSARALFGRTPKRSVPSNATPAPIKSSWPIRLISPHAAGGRRSERVRSWVDPAAWVEECLKVCSTVRTGECQ